MKTPLVVLLLAALPVSQAHAIVRYVNKTGSCAGGTPCFTTVQSAINASTAAGDVVEIEGDIGYIENVTVNARTNLTIRARAGNSPSIVTTNATALTIQNCPTLTLNGVNLNAAQPGRTAMTVSGTANRSDGLTVRNCVIRGGNGDAAGLTVSIANTLFENVEFLNAGNTTGYRASAATAKFVNNVVRNCRFTASRRHIVLANQHNFLLEDCIISRHTDTQIDPALRPAIEISGSAFTDAVPPGITIRRNLIWAFHGAAVRVGVATPAGQNIVIEHNTIVSSGEPDGRDGIVFRGGSTGVVRNNVIVSDGKWAALATDASTPGLVQNNNLIVNSGSLTSVPFTFPITATSVPALGPGSIVDSSAGFVDEFTLDFRLSCASAGVGASTTGTNLGYTNALSVADCADCASLDSDSDGVNDCADRCPFTPLCVAVDSVGCPSTTTLFGFGSVWQYDDRALDLDNPANGNPTWRSTGLTTPTFGPGQLGFGELDQATVITRTVTNPTYYFSKLVSIPNPGAVAELRLEVLYDDGYVAYVNGVEVGRSANMPTGTITYNTLADYDAENWIDRGIFIPPGVLVPGNNVIVVEVHQELPTSSDLSFDARLTATLLDAAPSITCPAGTTASAGANCQAQIPDVTGSVVISGGCGPFTVTQSPAEGTTVGLGTHIITVTVTDASGATAQCTTTFTVTDTTPPSAICPASIIVSANGNCQAAIPDITAAVSASDNCTPAALLTTTQSPSAGTQVGLGTHTITATVTDEAGNSAECATTVTVKDTTPPTVSCPQNQSVQCASQVPATDISSVTAQDNCDTPVVSFVGDVISGQTCPDRFTVTRTYSAADLSANSSICAQIITVNDTTPPAITCPADITVQGENNVPAPDPGTVTASDNCSTVGVTHVGDSTASATCGSVITRTYRATDACASPADCTQVITVTRFFANDCIMWHAPLARAPANHDTDPSAGGTLKYTFKGGSAIPIQVHAQGCATPDVTTNPGVTGFVQAFADTNCDGMADGNALPIDFNGVGGSGGMMDKINDHLKYNLDTKTLTTPGCYVLRVTVKANGEQCSETVLLQRK